MLIVDDDPKVRAALSRSLRRKHGFEVAVAASADEAEAKLREGPIDGALVDLCMPDRSGLEVLRSIRRAYPAAFLCLITGSDPVDDIRNKIGETGAGFLAKPFSSANLGGWIDGVWRAHKARVTPLDLIDGSDRLTRRQRECLELALASHTSRAVARIIDRKISTIRSHMRRAYQSLGVKNMDELVVRLDEAAELLDRSGPQPE